MAESPRVLSVQSHVVFGYVGNKSATLPLQGKFSAFLTCLPKVPFTTNAFDVDAINSVQFSNHTGYGKVSGQVLTDTDLGDLVDGLATNGLDHYTHLLTGYIGSPSFLNRIASLVKHLKNVNPNLVYVCDPVMGDNGKMYVPKELLPIYKETILPLADILTPNQYEVELLTGLKINTIDDAWKAIEILHKKGCRTVVLSSTELGDDKHLLALASTKAGDSNSAVKIEIPKLPACFTGTGDLFTSLFLAWTYKTNNRIKEALERTIGTLQAVLKRTLAHATEVGLSPKSLELKLIQSKADIENPDLLVFATVV